MGKRILKFVAFQLNIKRAVDDYKLYVLVDTCMTANEEMLDYLFEEGCVETAPNNTYRFTEKALKILHEE